MAMAEVGKDKDIKVDNAPAVDVDLGDGRFGVELKRKGQTFHLINLTNSLNGEATIRVSLYNQVFFRTESGNIFSLDIARVLVDKNKSKVSGKLVGEELDKETLMRARLIVGRGFDLGKTVSSDPISEIVLVYAEYSDSIAGSLPVERNSIREDFMKDLPPLSNP